jgi:hypothetical protein
MAKTAPRTILLRNRGYRKEAEAGGTITPGHLIAFNSTGKFVVHATALVKAAPIFAVENDVPTTSQLAGTDPSPSIDTNYVSGDFVQGEVCHPGVEINALVAAAAPAIAVGDLLESAGNGTLRKFTTGIVVGVALEALDNSGGGSAARLRVMTA